MKTSGLRPPSGVTGGHLLDDEASSSCDRLLVRVQPIGTQEQVADCMGLLAISGPWPVRPHVDLKGPEACNRGCSGRQLAQDPSQAIVLAGEKHCAHDRPGCAGVDK
jgi:hypothetical protein